MVRCIKVIIMGLLFLLLVSCFGGSAEPVVKLEAGENETLVVIYRKFVSAGGLAAMTVTANGLEVTRSLSGGVTSFTVPNGFVTIVVKYGFLKKDIMFEARSENKYLTLSVVQNFLTNEHTIEDGIVFQDDVLFYDDVASQGNRNAVNFLDMLATNQRAYQGQNCPVCGGSGRCVSCKGSGKCPIICGNTVAAYSVSCLICQGSGKHNLPGCEGTGECQRCKGQGAF